MDADSRPQEGLRRHLLRRLVLEVPDAVAVRQRLEVHAALGLDADLEPAWNVHSRGASDGRVDGVTAAWSREDAIAGKFKFIFCSESAPAHVEQQVRVVLRIHGNKRVLPLARRQSPRQPILDVPEDGPPQVHVVLHEAHALVAGPALLVVVPNNIFVVRVRLFC